MGKWIFFALLTLSRAHASCEGRLANPLAHTRASSIYAGLIAAGSKLSLYLDLSMSPGAVTFASRAQLEMLQFKTEGVKSELKSIDVETADLEPYCERLAGLRDAVRRATIMEPGNSIRR